MVSWGTWETETRDESRPWAIKERGEERGEERDEEETKELRYDIGREREDLRGETEDEDDTGDDSSGEEMGG